MDTVYFCEKPSQARDIGKVLGVIKKEEGCLTGTVEGRTVLITWGFGHLLEQAYPESYNPEFKTWNLESLPIIPDAWKMKVTASGKKQFNLVKRYIGKAKEIIIATDADREGETIAREILDYCQYVGPVKRLWLSALDDASVRKALSNMLVGSETFPLYQAGLGRSRADWLVGLNMTRACTVLAQKSGFQGVVSIGRVQTPTVRLVVDRDRQIESFVPVDYWNVVATIQAEHGSFNAVWHPNADAEYSDSEGRCVSKDKAFQLMQKCDDGELLPYLSSVETTRKKEQAPLVMDLSSLQQEGSKRWGYGAQQILDAAQALYEKHKATTYPRTDCRYLPLSQLTEVNAVINAIRQSDPTISTVLEAEAMDYSRKSRVWNDTKITAHHGIICTSAACDMQAMSEVERNLYQLIRTFYLAQFMPVHEYDKTDVVVDMEAKNSAASGERYSFKTSGSRVLEEGWKTLFSVDKTEEEKEGSDEVKLPKLEEGELSEVIGMAVKGKKTTPPKPFTEGTLIAAMKNAARFVTDEKLKAMLRETSGIGTEATRASIIETLFKREYLVKKGRALGSSDLARALVDSLPNALSNPGMTALWEQGLDEIATGKLSLDEFMTRQRGIIERLIQHAKSEMTLDFSQFKTAETKPNSNKKVTTTKPKVPKIKKCSACGADMKQTKGAFGQFWGCTNYPQCKKTVKK